jgi:2-isopropylmalate synthase
MWSRPEVGERKQRADKHSGRHAFRERVKELGFELSDELNRLFDEFKALADKKKQLFDGDIEALVMRSGNDAARPWSLHSLRIRYRRRKLRGRLMQGV